MSFFESCKDVHIEIKGNSPFLVCYARDQYGSYPQAEMRLDEFIGNDDGMSSVSAVHFYLSSDL
jgi:hypothetical protein